MCVLSAVMSTTKMRICVFLYVLNMECSCTSESVLEDLQYADRIDNIVIGRTFGQASLTGAVVISPMVFSLPVCDPLLPRHCDISFVIFHTLGQTIFGAHFQQLILCMQALAPLSAKCFLLFFCV